MTRVSFFVPEDYDGELSPETVRDALGLVFEQALYLCLDGWSRIELLVAYDYAMRVHLRAADNHQVRRRARPAFLEAAFRSAKEADEADR